MKFPINRTAKIHKAKGAGDVVAMVAEPIKKAIIKHMPPRIAELMKNCNCDKRKELLNKLIPFNRE